MFSKSISYIFSYIGPESEMVLNRCCVRLFTIDHKFINLTGLVMLKIIGFLALALVLTQGVQAKSHATVEQAAPNEVVLLEDDLCTCSLPEWKANLILKFASKEFQYPLMDLMDAYSKDELTIDEITLSNGDIWYQVSYAPCGSCGVVSDQLFN